jgi:hypothetical protein
MGYTQESAERELTSGRAQLIVFKQSIATLTNTVTQPGFLLISFHFPVAFSPNVPLLQRAKTY